MKNQYRMYLCFAAMNIAVFAMGNSYALDYNSATAEQLYDEQARINQFSRRADEVIDVHGRYVLIRDKHIYGVGGIYEKSNAWFGEVTSWVNTLNGIINYTRMVNAKNLATADTRAKLKTEINKANAKLRKITSDAGELQNLCNLALQELSRIPVLPTDYIANYEQQIAFIKQKIDAEKNSIDLIKGSIDSTLSVTLRDLMENTRIASDALMRLASLSFPELKTAMDEMIDALSYEKVTAPYFDEINTYIGKINTYVNGSYDKRRVFEASDLYLILVARASQIKTEVDRSNLLDAQKVSVKNEIDSMVAKANTTRSTALADAALHVKLYYGNTVTDIAPACQTVVGQKRYNCQLLRNLVGLDANTFNTLTVDKLRFLESSLSKVYEGPLVVEGI